MSRSIYKYQLELVEHQVIQVPCGAEFLSAHSQSGTICVWALVEMDSDKIPRGFTIIGTGNPIPDNYQGKFIGTVLQGQFVWHVFVDDEVK